MEVAAREGMIYAGQKDKNFALLMLEIFQMYQRIERSEILRGISHTSFIREMNAYEDIVGSLGLDAKR